MSSTTLRVFVAVALPCLVNACASVEVPNYPAHISGHILPVKPDGRLSTIASIIDDQDVAARVPNADADPLNEIHKALLDEIAEAKAERRKAKHILLYIHGGLNTRKESLRRAADLLLNPNGLPADYFPIFVNWQSDFGSAYGDHLTKIWQGEEANWRWVWFIKAPVYLGTDVAKSVVEAPKSWLVQGIHGGQSLFNNFDCDPEKGVSCVPPNFDYECRSDREAPWLVPQLAKVATTPMVVEFGRPAWVMMLRRTQTLFWTSDAMGLNSGDDEQYAQNNRGDDCDGCGGLNLLAKRLAKLQKSYHIHISLIGHSMGAIVANRLVAEAPEIRFDNIVHMASADSIDNTLALTFNYMRTPAGKGAQFYALMLQGDRENREVRVHGLVPSGSLLTWIDNMFTDPPTSQSRRAGRWSNMERFMSQIPADISGRVHFTVFAEKAAGHPLNHGDFGNCRFWTKPFWDGTDPKSAQ